MLHRPFSQNDADVLVTVGTDLHVARGGASASFGTLPLARLAMRGSPAASSVAHVVRASMLPVREGTDTPANPPHSGGRGRAHRSRDNGTSVRAALVGGSSTQ